MTDSEKSSWESFKVTGDEILSKVKEIIKEGNARLKEAGWESGLFSL